MKIEELLILDNIKNKVIAFPTDTVYGVGCLIDDEQSIKRIYELKKRDQDKPLAILVGSIEQANDIVKALPKKAVELMEKHWPGALTIICEKNENVPSFLNPLYKTIGIRMPKSKIALAILQKYGPMAVTSVNKSGEAPLNTFDEINNAYQNEIDYIIESNESSSNVSSTVIEINQENIKIIRQGNIII